MPDTFFSNTDRVRAIYDRLAPRWNQREARGEGLLMGGSLRQALGRYLRGDVLELGSGTGATFPFLDWSDAGVHSVTATDLSEGMLGQARRHDAIVGRTVSFRQLDATALPFATGSFDTVTTSLMLCTVPDPATTLREMSRVTHPDGRLVLLEHVRAPNRVLATLQRWMSPWQERRMGCHLDRPTDALVRQLGFPIEHHEQRFLSIFHLLVLRPLPREDD